MVSVRRLRSAFAAQGPGPCTRGGSPARRGAALRGARGDRSAVTHKVSIVVGTPRRPGTFCTRRAGLNRRLAWCFAVRAARRLVNASSFQLLVKKLTFWCSGVARGGGRAALCGAARRAPRGSCCAGAQPASSPRVSRPALRRIRRRAVRRRVFWLRSEAARRCGQASFFALGWRPALGWHQRRPSPLLTAL